MSSKPSTRIIKAGEAFEFESLKRYPDVTHDPKLSMVNRIKGEIEQIKIILDEEWLKNQQDVKTLKKNLK